MRLFGAGIQLSPNSMHVLDGLGLSDALRAVSHQPSGIDIRDGKTGRRLTRFQLGAPFEARYSEPYLAIRRAALIETLAHACEVHSRIAMEFGREVDPAKVPHPLIGADGVWSNVRQAVSGAALPAFTGAVAWRAVIQQAQLPAALDPEATHLFLMPSAHLLAYGLDEDEINLVLITKWRGSEPPERRWSGLRVEGSPPGLPNRLADVVSTLLDNAAGQWTGWPLYAVEKPGSLSDGTIALIGDAGHAMVPYAAQGGSAAIEDAAVLADACRTHSNISAAFAAYDTARLPRLRRLLALAGNNRRLYHMAGLPALVRNMGFPLVPQAVMQARMRWVYGWQPSVIPVDRNAPATAAANASSASTHP